jgi:large subunit ribosomal protein L25
MQTITLQATKRDLKGRKNYMTRNGGNVPAVLYGSATPEPKSIAVDRKALTAAFKQVGESTLVDLVIDNETPVKVLIQDLQLDPMRSEVIHADFRSVDMTKPIEAEVKLHFVGEAPAVKELGGTMVHVVDAIEVEALPGNLIPSIDVDVTSLKTFDDAVRIKDLVMPPGVEALGDANMTLALVEAPRSEEELAELDKAVEIDVSAVEVAGKKEKEGEEGEGVEEAEGAEGTKGPAAEEKKKE